MTIRRQIPAPDPPGCHDTTIDALTDEEIAYVVNHPGEPSRHLYHVGTLDSWLFSLACEVKYLREREARLIKERDDLDWRIKGLET